MFSFLTRGKNKIKTYHAGFSSKKKENVASLLLESTFWGAESTRTFFSLFKIFSKIFEGIENRENKISNHDNKQILKIPPSLFPKIFI